MGEAQTRIKNICCFSLLTISFAQDLETSAYSKILLPFKPAIQSGKMNQ
jgi:hypothetical protein